MHQITQRQKARYAALSASVDANIQRHKQISIRDELMALSLAADASDARDTYGSGGIVEAFETHLSTLLNKPACVFLPTGTLAQCVAMKVHSQHTGRKAIGLHPTSHLLLHEHMSIEHLWQLDVTYLGAPQLPLSVDDLKEADNTDLCAIIVELPMREIGGVLPDWQDLIALREWCDEHDVKLHLDGARIWQTTAFYQRSLAQIVSVFDSVYVSFYKDLNGTFGAALLGDNSLIADARIWARRAGGNPITLYAEVLAARAGLDTYLPKMPEFVAFAGKLAAQLQSKGIGVVPVSPRASMFHLKFDIGVHALTERILSYAEKHRILVLPLPREGDDTSSVTEISIGEMALEHSPEYWCQHILACLYD